MLLTLYTIIDIIHTSTTQTETRGSKMRALTEKLRSMGVSEDEIYNLEGKAKVLAKEYQMQGLDRFESVWLACKKVANVDIQE